MTPKPPFALVRCLQEISSSSNPLARRSALKHLETMCLSNLTASTAVTLLTGTDHHSGEKGGETVPPLGNVLLKVITDKEAPELVREKAAFLLHTCWNTVATDTGTDTNGNTREELNSSFLSGVYIHYCRAFYDRFHPRPSTDTSGGGVGGGTDGSCGSPAEDAEEIRLLLVRIVSDLLSCILATHRDCHSNSKNEGQILLVNDGIAASNSDGMDGDASDSVNDDGGGGGTNTSNPTVRGNSDAPDPGSRAVHAKHTDAATSLLCQSLAKTALCDPYPDLKRESCLVVQKLVRAFPRIVRMHGEALLRPITGGTISSRGSGNEKLWTAQSTCETSNHCLLKHRHAKTRSLALEASASIVTCFSILDGEAPASCLDDGERGSTGGTLSDLLLANVLPKWECLPPYDRSVAVRVALAKAVGRTLVLVVRDASTRHELRRTNMEESMGGLKLNGPCHARLLVLLLMGICDDSKDVRIVASTELNNAANVWKDPRVHCQLGTELSSGEENDACQDVDAKLIAVFASGIFFLLLTDGYANRSLTQRIRSIETLNIAIQMLNRVSDCKSFSSISSRWTTTHILFVLCECIAQDETAIVNAAIQCAFSLGSNADWFATALELLLSGIRGKSDNSNDCGGSDNLSHCSMDEVKCFQSRKTLLFSTPQQYVSAFRVLSGLIRGSQGGGSTCKTPCFESEEMTVDIKVGESNATAISAALMMRQCVEQMHASKAVSCAILDVCHAVVNVYIESDTDEKFEMKLWKEMDLTVRNILYSCVHLLGAPREFGLHAPTMAFLNHLSCLFPGLETTSELLDIYFERLVWLFTEDKKSEGEDMVQLWKVDDPDLRGFDALLRVAGSGKAVGENFHLISPVLERHLCGKWNVKSNDSRQLEVAEYQTKLFVMALLESIISEPSFPNVLLHPFTERMLESSIIPNLVWRAGGMACALRKVSAATLFSLLRVKGATERTLYLIAPKLLPVLKSNLGDDDEITRELVCCSLSQIFNMLPGALGEEPVHQLYPDLIKCLDDGSESVRFSACRALQSFLRSAPREHLQGTAIEYIVENLFVHLDDPDAMFQDAILEVLTVTLDVDSKVVFKNVETARLCHRTEHFCNRLVQHANDKERNLEACS